MDPDFALGMLKTISTFLDFFATIKFLKKQLQTLQLLNFWISRQNLIRLQNDLRSIFFWLQYWLRGYVGAWLAFRPGDWGSNLTWAKLFFFTLIIIFKWKLFFTSLWYSKPLLYYSFFKFVMSSWQYLESKHKTIRRRVM